MREIDDETLQPLVARLSLEEKVQLLTGRDSWSLHALPKIGLRSIVVSDGPVGVRGATWDERSPSVNFPSPSAVAASWDRSVAGRVGQSLGDEARRKGVDVVLAPTINLHRSPYGGRHFEAFSEDPVLTAELATAYVRGVQSRGVGATVKHYVANDSETERFTVDVRVSDRALRELYLLAFEQPVVEGPSWLVMSAYNSVNGARATENALLTTPLNDEWRFDGVVVSDWTAVRSVESARHPQDLVMPGPDGAWGTRLVEAVRAGDVDEETIDRKVRRMLRLAARVGALESFLRADGGPEDAPPPVVAREVATNGMVLLSNRAVLPLAAPTSIALIGESGRAARIQGGGSATVIPDRVISPLDGVRARWPEARVEWALGAVVQTGVADLPAGSFASADGDPGLVVRYVDEAGTEIARESRTASSLVWFGTESPAATASVIELAFRYTPENHGARTPIGLAGLADYEVMADGVTVACGQLRTKPTDDPATAVLNPPFTSVTVPMAGRSVDLVVRFKPATGDIPDALSLRVGVPPLDRDPDELMAEAANVARRADCAVVIVSTSAEVESEGFDRESLRLPGRQDDLVRAVAKANPRTVVVVNAGAPVVLPWREEVGAVLATWFPGQEFGHALADVLSGDVEPGGRLPVTWPASEDDVPVRTVKPKDGQLVYDEGIHIGHRAYLRNGVLPAFPFGHGLGFTAWKLSDLQTPSTVAHGEDIEVRVTVRNVGGRAGKVVVQLYLERVAPSTVDRPVRWLAGFASAVVAAGTTVATEIPVSWRRFAHWDGEWRLEPGEFRLHAGLSVADVRLDGIIAAVGPRAVLLETPAARDLSLDRA